MQNNKRVPIPLQRSQKLSLNNLDWKGPQVSSTWSLFTKQGQLRPGCSELYPVRFWKPPRTETARPPWGTCPTTWLSCMKKLCRMSSLNPSSFHLCPLPFFPLTMHHPEEPGCFLSPLPTAPARLLSGPLKPSLLQAEPAQLPQPPPPGKVFQHPTTIVALCWTHAVCQWRSCSAGAKTGHGILGMIYQVLSRGNDTSLPTSSWPCPRFQGQEAAGRPCCPGTVGSCTPGCPRTPWCSSQVLTLAELWHFWQHPCATRQCLLRSSFVNTKTAFNHSWSEWLHSFKSR